MKSLLQTIIYDCRFKMSSHDLNEFEYLLREMITEQKPKIKKLEEREKLYLELASLVAECLEHSRLVTFFNARLDPDSNPDIEGKGCSLPDDFILMFIPYHFHT